MEWAMKLRLLRTALSLAMVPFISLSGCKPADKAGHTTSGPADSKEKHTKGHKNKEKKEAKEKGDGKSKGKKAAKEPAATPAPTQ